MNNATDYSPTKKIDMILLPSVDHHLSLIIANFAFLHLLTNIFVYLVPDSSRIHACGTKNEN